MLSSFDIKDSGKVSEKILKVTKELKSLIVPFPEVLIDAVVNLHSLVMISDKVLPLKSYFNVLQTVLSQQASMAGKVSMVAHRSALTEDTFMVACAVLDVDIGRQGGVSYLKGAVVDGDKERKLKRVPIDLTSEIELKNLSAGLARPDEERGGIERGQIESGYNHLVKLTRMRRNMLDAVQWIKEGEAMGTPRRKVDVMSRYGIKNIEYEKMMTLARKEKLISFKNKKLSDDNNYRLSVTNHQKIIDRAAELGHKPERLLNNLVSDFFKIIEKRKQHKLVKTAKAPKASKVSPKTN